MIKNNCLTCGKQYLYPASRKVSKHCSRICMARRVINNICEFCNKEFDNKGNINQKTCSKICEGKYIALKNFKEYKDKKFGRLTILELDLEKDNSHGYFYKTICVCGEIKSYRRDNLQEAGNNGCIKCGTFIYGMSKKGLKHTKTFTIWKAILQRCDSPKSMNYYLYGGRGIKVCDRWRKYENFLEDMGERPAGLQIDRIDNDGNYEPGNCRWVTASENSKNKRNVYNSGYMFIKKDKLCEECKSKTYTVDSKD